MDCLGDLAGDSAAEPQVMVSPASLDGEQTDLQMHNESLIPFHQAVLGNRIVVVV